MEVAKNENLPVILKVEDVAKYLSISRATAYELIKAPDFPAIRVHRKRVVIPRDRFLQWVDKKADEPLDVYIVSR